MRQALFAAAVAVCAVVSTTTTAAAASSGWSVVVTPNPAGARASGLAAVTCSAAGACTAVGQFQRGARVLPLAERWNGTGFSIQPTPTPAGSPAFSALSGVSCPAAHECTAVGNYVTSALSGFTLAERWDGTTWSIQRTANRPAALASQLLGVSCPTATVCTAVGSYQKNVEQSFVLAERWNGATWSLQRIPSPPGSSISSLTAVSCSAVNACTAVGTFTSHGEDLPLAERWNGSTWSIQPVPTPTSEGGDLAGVSCTAVHACTAVGEFVDQADAHSFALAERWNGSAWSIQRPPTPPGGVNAFLGGVSCPASTACTAVGDYVIIRANKEVTLAEHWDGTTWSVQSTPHPGNGTDGLTAVACPATTSCIAVGVQFRRHGRFFPLGERFAA